MVTRGPLGLRQCHTPCHLFGLPGQTLRSGSLASRGSGLSPRIGNSVVTALHKEACVPKTMSDPSAPVASPSRQDRVDALAARRGGAVGAGVSPPPVPPSTQPGVGGAPPSGGQHRGSEHDDGRGPGPTPAALSAAATATQSSRPLHPFASALPRLRVPSTGSANSPAGQGPGVDETNLKSVFAFFKRWGWELF